jgi:hypothetical protein
MDADTLPNVVMPNHAGFTSPDPRPDVFNSAGATRWHGHPFEGSSRTARETVCFKLLD